MRRFGKLKSAVMKAISSKKALALSDRGYEKSAHDSQLLTSHDEYVDPSGRVV